MSLIHPPVYINLQSFNILYINCISSNCRNLEVIGVRNLIEYFASLSIEKTSLKSLGLRSLKKLQAESIANLESSELAFAEGID